MGFLALLDRLNAAHPWSHNDAFAGFVLGEARAVRRRGGDTVVDVGCGTGNLLGSLSRCSPPSSAVRPGGRVVIVGVARETPRDAVRSVASLLLNPLVGLARHPARATRPPSHMRAPTVQATESYDEIHVVASAVLPGIRMRRRLFWRYTASWTAPRGDQEAVRPA